MYSDGVMKGKEIILKPYCQRALIFVVAQNIILSINFAKF